MPSSKKPPTPLIHIDPQHIRFTHSRIRPRFSGCGRTLQSTLDAIVSGQLKPEDLPTISVVELPAENDPPPKFGGSKPRRKKSAPATAAALPQYFSLNNRRLWVFKSARAQGILETIPARLETPTECKRLRDRFTADRCSLTAKLMRERGDGKHAYTPDTLSAE